MKLLITEQQYIKLSESKDYVYGNYNGKTIEVSNEDWDAVPFVYFNNKVYIGYCPELGYDYKEDGYVDDNGENDYPNFHTDIMDFYKFVYRNDPNYQLELPKRRNTYDFLGRIWVDSEVISFWKYPQDINTLKNILTLLHKEFKTIYDFDINYEDYKVDINLDEDDNTLISLKDYVKGNDATEDEMEQPHLLPSKEKRETQQMKAVRDYDAEMKAEKFKNVPEYQWNFEKTKNLAEDETQEPKNVAVNKNKEQFFNENNINPDNLSFLGKGDFGTAYSIGDGRVLKITNSKQEFEIAKQLENDNAKVLESFAKIFKTEIVDNNMMIILEELYEDSNIENLFYQLEDILNEQGLPIQYLYMLDYDLLDLDDDMIRFIDQIDDINRAYRYIGIEASDMKPDNFGYDRNGILKAFDIDNKKK
jgi:hypothetical protein